MQEAQAAADKGVAAIGISEDRIVVLCANDEEQSIAQTASVMTLDESTSAFAVEGMRYYSYRYGTTTSGGGSGTSCRKAIMIVPGVMGTELKLTAAQNGLPAGTQVWPPLQDNEDFSNTAVVNEILKKLASNACDTSGNSMYDLCVKNDDNYGAFDHYKSLYNELSIIIIHCRAPFKPIR